MASPIQQISNMDKFINEPLNKLSKHNTWHNTWHNRRCIMPSIMEYYAIESNENNKENESSSPLRASPRLRHRPIYHHKLSISRGANGQGVNGQYANGSVDVLCRYHIYIE